MSDSPAPAVYASPICDETARACDAVEVIPEPRDDPVHLAGEQRRHEIAAILAKGVLRLCGGAGISPDSPACGDAYGTDRAESRSACDNSSESGQNGLELSATSSPHATQG